MLRTLKLKIDRLELPTVAEFVEVRKQSFVEQLCGMIEEKEHEAYLSFAEELLTLSDHPAELVAALLKLRFNKTLLPESYTELVNTPDEPNVPGEGAPGARSELRLRFATGKAMGVSVPEILIMISDRTGIRARQMGRIDCHDDFTYINVNDEAAKILLDAFRDSPLQATEVPFEEGAPAAALKKKRKPFRRDEGFPRRFGHPSKEYSRKKPRPEK